MIDLSLLTDGGVGWLDASGPSSHLVLSTRIRLARNLAGRVFQGRNYETAREDIISTVARAVPTPDPAASADGAAFCGRTEHVTPS